MTVKNYPSVTDKNIIDKVDKEFKEYRFDEKYIRKPQKELCIPPSNFKPQLSQRFVANFMNPKSPYTGLLVYHQIGSGKTCTAIQVSKPYIGKRKIFFIVPAFLKNNIRDELIGPCGGYGEANAHKIDKDYTILSYHKFVSLIDENDINLNNSLVVVDEVQNIVSETGNFYSSVRKAVDRAKNLRILLLSATPIYDQPHELAKTLNLIPRADKDKLPEGMEFDKTFLQSITTPGSSLIEEYTMKNKRLMVSYLNGYVSYFKGMPKKTFPEATIKIVLCPMEEFQYKSYQAVVSKEQKLIKKHSALFKMPNNFFIGSRMISNIAYPNRKAGSDGYTDFVETSLERRYIKRYSIKFYKLLGKLSRNYGNAFIYSNFVEFGGLYPLRLCLLANGWYDFVETVKQNEKIKSNRKYFALWTSNENNDMKQIIKTQFNNSTHPLRLILGSPSLREGVSLLRVRQVHILEPYWNLSRLEQVMGRAIRFCSHSDLPKAEQKVDVYIYLAIRPQEKEIYRSLKDEADVSPLEKYSVDRYIMKLAELKGRIVDEFTDLMKATAVDCKLNVVINNEGKKHDEKIVCKKTTV